MTPTEPRERQSPIDRRREEMIPRLPHQGYTRELIDRRRGWLEGRTGVAMPHVGAYSAGDEEMRGNVENPVGAAQVPLGIAGPLTVEGEHARGTFYVPLATTEGALVRSYERGMAALTRAGGATVRLTRDENRMCPAFLFDDVAAAHRFAEELPRFFEEARAAAEATTRHGRLLRLEPLLTGRQVLVTFAFSTGDAHGMNMIARATDRACRRLMELSDARRYLLFSGAEAEKKAAGNLLAGGKGKQATAGALVPRRVVRSVLQTTPEEMATLWQQTVVGHLAAGSLGYNGHAANGLTALFIACGQDVANVVNSAVALTQLEATEGGDLYASVHLPSLVVASVGGGTGQGTARECLQSLGCLGDGGAARLAEIAAATVLAGELSMGAAIVSGQFVDAHEAYGRNRPPGDGEAAEGERIEP